MDGIKHKFPNHQFIGEEETSEGKKAVLTNAPTWIIDPIDGTLNFVHTFPHSSISIALLVNKVIPETLKNRKVLKFEYS